MTLQCKAIIITLVYLKIYVLSLLYFAHVVFYDYNIDMCRCSTDSTKYALLQCLNWIQNELRTRKYKIRQVNGNLIMFIS